MPHEMQTNPYSCQLLYAYVILVVFDKGLWHAQQFGRRLRVPHHMSSRTCNSRRGGQAMRTNTPFTMRNLAVYATMQHTLCRASGCGGRCRTLLVSASVCPACATACIRVQI